MKFERVPSPAGQEATHLWVMLPGAYMKPDDFIRAGFADAIRARRLPHAIDLLDASIADLVDGSALSFLQEHLASDSLPARRVCLLGISLGAQLAMLCLARAASDPLEAAQRVAHALVMAPYLGPRDLVAEVAAGGGLDASPATGAIDAEREIWRWLRNPVAAGPPLYLGYGIEDRFAHAHALMATTLPEGRVDTQPGGHDWPVWTALWHRHLERFDG